MSRAITEDSTGATGRKQDHLSSEMQRNEIIMTLEDLLQPIKESISSLLTEERSLGLTEIYITLKVTGSTSYGKLTQRKESMFRVKSRHLGICHPST